MISIRIHPFASVQNGPVRVTAVRIVKLPCDQEEEVLHVAFDISWNDGRGFKNLVVPIATLDPTLQGPIECDLVVKGSFDNFEGAGLRLRQPVVWSKQSEVPL